MRKKFTWFYLFVCYWLFNFQLSFAQISYESLQASLWKAPKDSIPKILERISQKIKEEKIEDAKKRWRDLLNTAQQKTELAVVVEVYKANSNYFSSLNRKGDQIGIVMERLQFVQTNQLLIEQGVAYLDLANIYRETRKFDKALENYLTALDLFQKRQDSTHLYRTYTDLGDFYYSQDIKKSRDYLFKAIALKKYAPNPRSIINNTNTIALTYKSEQDLANALKYFEMALQFANTYQDHEWVGIISGNTGMVYFQQKDYDKALTYIFKDLRTSKDDANTTNTYIGIGEIYLAKNQLPLAKAYLDSGMVLARKVKSINLLNSATKGYKKYYEQMKDYANAFKCAEEMLVYRDSLDKRKQLSQIKQVQSQYDFDKQEEQIAHLEEKSHLQNQNLQQQKLINYGILAVGAMLVFFMYYLYKNNAKTRKLNRALYIQKEEILTQNEELYQNQEEILSQRDFIEKQNRNLNGQNTQIRNSIKAALTIQHAILPFDSRIRQFFKEYFVVYQPKDIVSGDFYWVEKVGNQTIAAVADCTGHGVPGAFMSLIASNLLEKIIFQQNITQPASILTELHKLIRLALNQAETTNNYGLDIGIAVLEEQDEVYQKITFAGAKRPLHYISATEPDKVQIVAGTRKSIGGIQNENIVFEDFSLSLPHNSMIYLSSDGLVDQNDAKRNRLGEARLFQNLLSIQQMSLEMQKKSLLDLLEKQMKDTEQRDDILFLGFRI